MKNVFILAGIVSLLAACGNPGGISDEDYKKYKMAGAPKILYKCNEEIAMRWGQGALVTYNQLLERAQAICGPQNFELLDGKQ